MNGRGEPDNRIEDVIADAVKSYPLAPAPAGLAPAIMSRVRNSYEPRFELGWMDVALGVFGLAMAGCGWFLWQWLLTLNSPLALLPETVNSLDPLEIGLGAAGILAGLLVVGLCLFIALVALFPPWAVRLAPAPRDLQPSHS